MLPAEVMDPAYVKAVERLTDLGICAFVQVGLLLVLYFSLRDLSSAIRALGSALLSDEGLKDLLKRK
jgi:hypothetical protein